MASSSYQPVSDLQLSQLRVEWVPRDSVRPNKYNPNKMSWHDRQLLKQSILEDGWTQPIVTLMDGTIVDGEQRWTVAGLEIDPAEVQEIIDTMLERQAQGHPVSDSILGRLQESKRRLEAAGNRPTIAAITGGLVPITRVDFGDDAHKMIATIRHNRARGIHQIDAMAQITRDLVQLGLDFDDLETRLGMNDEEIQRFLRSADGLLEEAQQTFAQEGYSRAWEPVHIAALTEDEIIQNEIERSREAAKQAKAYQKALKERQEEIQRRAAEEAARLEAERQVALTQPERDALVAELESAVPKPPEPEAPAMRKLVMMVTVDEYALLEAMLGGERMAEALMELVRAAHTHWDVVQGWLGS